MGCTTFTQPSISTIELVPPGIHARRDDSMRAIRDLEAKVERDPYDFIAYAKLSDYYLRRARERADGLHLDLARRAAQKSLDVVPAAQNLRARAALVEVELASHEFRSARAHALELIHARPEEPYFQLLLGDALLELGEYTGARERFEHAVALGGESVATETRRARGSWLHGDGRAAEEHLATALRIAESRLTTPLETLAWCRWQMGELLFARGAYADAEAAQRSALTVLPDYSRAIASLGRAQAAQGAYAEAISQYRRAIDISPDPGFIGALADLYRRTEQHDAAARLGTWLARIEQLASGSDPMHARQLALYKADQDMDIEAAHGIARMDFAARPDIYAADAVAWTALKAGDVTTARRFIAKAVALGTRDARIFFHAGMIARAAGDEAEARRWLERALALSPAFDPIQAGIARSALDDLASSGASE